MSRRLTLRLAALAAALAVATAGCGLFGLSAPRKPSLYTVEGRVFDAATHKPIQSARIMVRATIPAVTNATGMPPLSGKAASLGGQMIMSGYGLTDTDGRYSVELSEGYQIARTATQIRIEASAPGYLAGSTQLSAPTSAEPSYDAPDIILTRPGVFMPPR
jgi:hypothetical protein